MNKILVRGNCLRVQVLITCNFVEFDSLRKLSDLRVAFSVNECAHTLERLPLSLESSFCLFGRSHKLKLLLFVEVPTGKTVISIECIILA